MKKIFLGLTLILVALIMVDCVKDEMEPDYYSSESTEGFMVTDQSVFIIDPISIDTTVHFTSNMWWYLTVSDSTGQELDWADVSPKAGRGNADFKIKCDSNFIMFARDAVVKIAPDGQSEFTPVEFTIRQNAAGPFMNLDAFEIEGDTMYVGMAGSSCAIKIHANMAWNINSADAPWFTPSSASGGGLNNVDEILCTYTTNLNGDLRVGKIVFEGDNFSRVLVIKQKARFDNSALTLEDDAFLIAKWTPVIGAVSYSLVFTDANDAPVSTIENIENTVLEEDLSGYFSSTGYSGVINIVLKALSTDPSIFSTSNKILSHSHFANGSGDGSEGNEYLITNMRHLNNINQSGELDKHYMQAADLDFTEVSEYIPVGADASRPFTGTYTGAISDNGKYKVTGRYCTIADASVSFFGMFGVIGSGAEISDLIFENCTLDLFEATSAEPTGFAHVVGVNYGGSVRNIEVENCEILLNSLGAGTSIGSVVGNNNNGESTSGLVENCSTTGGRIFTGDTDNSSKSYTVGGIVGQGTAGSAVKNCANISTPITTRGLNTGGIVGKDGSVVSCSNMAEIIAGTNAGGIVAFLSTYDDIGKCYNTGNIVYRYGQAGYKYGGIVGKVVGTEGVVKIFECFNSGNVIAEITDRPSLFGGIAGELKSTGEITNCYNTGDVTLPSTSAGKSAYAGGIVGDIGSQATSIIANCYVTGIVGDGGVTSVSGERCAIVGYRSSTIPVIRNTYYLPSCALKAFGGDDQGTNVVDVSAKSESELGSAGSYDASWDFSGIWSSPSGSYPYPQLKSVPHVTGNN